MKISSEANGREDRASRRRTPGVARKAPRTDGRRSTVDIAGQASMHAAYKAFAKMKM